MFQIGQALNEGAKLGFLVEHLDDQSLVVVQQVAPMGVRGMPEPDQGPQDSHAGDARLPGPVGDDLEDLPVAEIGGLVGVDAQELDRGGLSLIAAGMETS